MMGLGEICSQLDEISNLTAVTFFPANRHVKAKLDIIVTDNQVTWPLWMFIKGNNNVKG